jgi:hypothetical protein
MRSLNIQPYAFHHVLRSLFIPLRLATNARQLELVTDLDPIIDQVSNGCSHSCLTQDQIVDIIRRLRGVQRIMPWEKAQRP